MKKQVIDCEKMDEYVCDCVYKNKSIVQKQKSQLKKLHKRRHMNSQKANENVL